MNGTVRNSRAEGNGGGELGSRGTVTIEDVLAELTKGMALGRLPACQREWLSELMIKDDFFETIEALKKAMTWVLKLIEELSGVPSQYFKKFVNTDFQQFREQGEVLRLHDYFRVCCVRVPYRCIRKRGMIK